MTCYILYLTFWFCLIKNLRLEAEDVYHYLISEDHPNVGYDISLWTKKLNLQQCALVEIGDGFWAIFIEANTINFHISEPEIEMYFLGICDKPTLQKWNFCSLSLYRKRPSDCTFNVNVPVYAYPFRVHRQLCDIKILSEYGQRCNCKRSYANQKLYRVIGFPTCFYPPLPEGICQLRNICGVCSCSASTIKGKVHTISCNPRYCKSGPFCESAAESLRPVEIKSYWTDWTEPVACNNHTKFSQCSKDDGALVYTKSTCLNVETGEGDIGCLGPGTKCCDMAMTQCKCHVYEQNCVLKLIRQYRYQNNNKTEIGSDEFKHAGEMHFDSHRNMMKYKLRKIRNQEHNDDEEDEEDIDSENDEDIILEEDTKSKESLIRTTISERSEQKETLQAKHSIGKENKADNLDDDLLQLRKTTGADDDVVNPNASNPVNVSSLLIELLLSLLQLHSVCVLVIV